MCYDPLRFILSFVVCHSLSSISLHAILLLGLFSRCYWLLPVFVAFVFSLSALSCCLRFFLRYFFRCLHLPEMVRWNWKTYFPTFFGLFSIIFNCFCFAFKGAFPSIFRPFFYLFLIVFCLLLFKAFLSSCFSAFFVYFCLCFCFAFKGLVLRLEV